jgi:hypothetical protein
MPTYSEIQELYLMKHNHHIKTCWIAHVKAVLGLIPDPLNRACECPRRMRANLAQITWSMRER